MAQADVEWLGDRSILIAGKQVLTKYEGVWWRMGIIQGSSPVDVDKLKDVTVVHETAWINPLAGMLDGSVIFFDGSGVAERSSGNWYVPGSDRPLTNENMIASVIANLDSIEVLN